MEKIYCVYILTNKRTTVLYIGITSDLVKRIQQHKLKTFKGYTAKYNVYKLVYYETFKEVDKAIQREKTLKNLLRKKKEALININNPTWKDLFDEILSA